MVYELGTRVKVKRKGIDDTFEPSFAGMEGVVILYNDNNYTGNIKEDPLHVVEFVYNNDTIEESFWYEELEELA